MNDFLTTYWPHIASIATGLTALWGLASKFHASIIRHFGIEFADKFASKEHMVRLETKVDSLLQMAWEQHQRRRYDHAEDAETETRAQS